MTTTAYAIYTGEGREKTVIQNLKKAARKCKDILSAAFLYPGYVRVEVVAGNDSEIKSAKLDMPKGTRAIIEMVPGVIKIVGNGREAVPLD